MVNKNKLNKTTKLWENMRTPHKQQAKLKFGAQTQFVGGVKPTL